MDIPDDQAIIAKGVENISRGNFHYLEEAEYFAHLLEDEVSGIKTYRDLERIFGVTLGYIADRIKSHRYLYEETKNIILFINEQGASENEHVLFINEQDSYGESTKSTLKLQPVGLYHALAQLHHDALMVQEEENPITGKKTKIGLEEALKKTFVNSLSVDLSFELPIYPIHFPCLIHLFHKGLEKRVFLGLFDYCLDFF